MALPIKAPHTEVIGRAGVNAEAGLYLGNYVWLLAHAGVPTGGAGWAGPGTLVVDLTNLDIYMNTNTKASPTWTKKVD